MLCDCSQSREIYPYRKYDQFNLETFDEAQCVTKRDISRLSHVFQIVHKIVSCQGTVVNNIEALVCLTRYHFLEEIIQKFIRFLIKYSTIFTTDLITSLVFGTRIFLQRNNFTLHGNAIHQKIWVCL